MHDLYMIIHMYVTERYLIVILQYTMCSFTCVQLSGSLFIGDTCMRTCMWKTCSSLSEREHASICLSIFRESQRSL